MAYNGHMMRTHDSLEKHVAEGCTEGGRRSQGRQRTWWTGLTGWTSTKQQEWMKTENSEERFYHSMSHPSWWWFFPIQVTADPTGKLTGTAATAAFMLPNQHHKKCRKKYRQSIVFIFITSAMVSENCDCSKMNCSKWVSEQFVNGISVQNRLHSEIQTKSQTEVNCSLKQQLNMPVTIMPLCTNMYKSAASVIIHDLDSASCK